MSERNQPDRIAKKRTYEMMMAKSKPRKFDLIGELLSNYGEPDITREIFSYVDFTTLQQSRLVSKSWNHYLANDKKIWLQAMEKHLPNLIYFTNQLTINEEENSTFWKEVWSSSIEKADDDGSLKKIIQAFKKVQSIFEIVKICGESKQKRFQHFNIANWLPQNFNDDFVGGKVKKEIRREIKKNLTVQAVFGLETYLLGVDLEGHNWSQIIANLLGSWNWTLQTPHQFHNQVIDIRRRTQGKILREIKYYLLNE